MFGSTLLTLISASQINTVTASWYHGFVDNSKCIQAIRTINLIEIDRHCREEIKDPLSLCRSNLLGQNAFHIAAATCDQEIFNLMVRLMPNICLLKPTYWLKKTAIDIALKCKPKLKVPFKNYALYSKLYPGQSNFFISRYDNFSSLFPINGFPQLSKKVKDRLLDSVFKKRPFVALSFESLFGTATNDYSLDEIPNPMDIRKNWFNFQKNTFSSDHNKNKAELNQKIEWQPVKFTEFKKVNSQIYSPIEPNGLPLSPLYRELPEWNQTIFDEIKKNIEDIEKENKETIKDIGWWIYGLEGLNYLAGTLGESYLTTPEKKTNAFQKLTFRGEATGRERAKEWLSFIKAAKMTDNDEVKKLIKKSGSQVGVYVEQEKETRESRTLEYANELNRVLTAELSSIQQVANDMSSQTINNIRFSQKEINSVIQYSFDNFDDGMNILINQTSELLKFSFLMTNQSIHRLYSIQSQLVSVENGLEGLIKAGQIYHNEDMNAVRNIGMTLRKTTEHFDHKMKKFLAQKIILFNETNQTPNHIVAKISFAYYTLGNIYKSEKRIVEYKQNYRMASLRGHHPSQWQFSQIINETQNSIDEYTAEDYANMAANQGNTNALYWRFKFNSERLIKEQNSEKQNYIAKYAAFDLLNAAENLHGPSQFVLLSLFANMEDINEFVFWLIQSLRNPNNVGYKIIETFVLDCPIKFNSFCADVIKRLIEFVNAPAKSIRLLDQGVSAVITIGLLNLFDSSISGKVGELITKFVCDIMKKHSDDFIITTFTKLIQENQVNLLTKIFAQLGCSDKKAIMNRLEKETIGIFDSFKIDSDCY